jgi:hypothetical protein
MLDAVKRQRPYPVSIALGDDDTWAVLTGAIELERAYIRQAPPEADTPAVDLLRDIREAVTLAREALDDRDETEVHALLSNVQARIDAALKEAKDG